MKARNASGLSDLSNTLTATVPAAKKEEVLIVARHESVDNTLVSNLGETAAPAGAVAGLRFGIDREIAMPFTTGTNAFGYHLTSIQLYLRQDGISASTPQVSIRADNEGVPSETVLSTFTTSTALTATSLLITFATPNEVTLQPGTKYWLYVSATGGPAGLQETASDDEDAESQPGWQIGDDRLERRDGGTWDPPGAPASDILRMKIFGHVGPPTLVSNLGQTAAPAGVVAGLRFGIDREIAMPFTTGTNAFGYHLTSIQLYLRQDGISASTPQVSIRADNEASPARPSYPPSPLPRHSQPLPY